MPPLPAHLLFPLQLLGGSFQPRHPFSLDWRMSPPLGSQARPPSPLNPLFVFPFSFLNSFDPFFPIAHPPPLRSSLETFPGSHRLLSHHRSPSGDQSSWHCAHVPTCHPRASLASKPTEGGRLSVAPRSSAVLSALGLIHTTSGKC